MQTAFVTKDKLTDEIIKQAAETLKNGGLVAFPTETVYGLGADGLNAKAVKSIFEAKGRPSDNPLILHISDKKQLEKIVKTVNKTAKALMDAFWPGPLTLVMEKTDAVPNETSGGLSTVAVRFPAHPLALKLIEAAGVPIAAPSANTSGRPSPTKAEHVKEDMDGKIPWILDGGSCDIGVESTVVDVTGENPIILRPGKITFEQISELFPETSYDKHLTQQSGENFAPRSPGMKYKHYAPKGELVILSGTLEKIQKYIDENSNEKSAVLTFDQYKISHNSIYSLGNIENLEEGCKAFFDHLRTFDGMKIEKIFAVMPLRTGIGFALYNRMFKAAGGKVIYL
ncbi:MAG: threonylcarbamoyl-AMP synthase [Clostridia bacterium]|nr:threonylcarbamoyl-AMP synthase [Clostridia bacterium]